MSRRVVATFVALVCALGGAAAAPAVGGATSIGIGDGNPAIFSSPRFEALHATVARDVVPWDVATRRADRGALATARSWIHAVQAAHVRPLISFGADGGRASNYIPSIKQYKRAVAAFLRRFPKVRDYTAWNEPDFSWRRLARMPQLAAGYFNALYNMCHRCTVAAGDLYLPTSGAATINGAKGRLGPWLRAYIPGLRHRPKAWALHDYHEVRAHNAAQLRTMMSVTSGPIWLDETGGVLRRGTWPHQSAARAANDEKFLFSLGRRFHRVARIYHYQWIGSPPNVGWDSGLLTLQGKPRPAYWVVLQAAHSQK
ncbi:MAG: hypothetical protein JOZ73_03335 [Solirubrobacterales bacterium]|nr:hypothetical protein [Solirubrobacterales bacterium]